MRLRGVSEGRLGRLSKLIALMVSACLCPAARGADESVYFAELPIIASVSRLPQRLADAPSAVTVIDRDMIRASGVRDLSDIFRLVPGFQTYPHTTEAARVGYHGLSDEEFSPRLQVLVDGRSLYSPLFANGVNWATIPVAIDDIERIEVVRGGNAVSYGSNAFLGVINIVTVDPALVPRVTVSGSHGSQNVRDHGVRLAGKLGENGDFRLTYRQQNDDALTNQYDWVDSYRFRLFDLRADYALGKADTLQLGLGEVVGVTERGRLDTTTFASRPTNPIRDHRQTSRYLQLTWRHVLSDASDIQLRYAHVLDKSDDGFDIAIGGQTYHVNQSGDEGARHEIELQHTARLPMDVRLVWGGSWRSDTIRSQWVLPGQGEVGREVTRLFGNLEWKPKDWFTGNLGFSAEEDTLAGFHPASRVSGNFHLTRENTVRLGYSHAYRTGSSFDYRGNYWLLNKYQYSADRHVRSEVMDTWELGFLGDWRAWRSSLDIRLFSEKVKDRLFIIDLDPNNNALPDTTLPIQDVHIRGLEYQLRWQPLVDTRLIFNQAFVRIGAHYLDSALAIPKSTLTHAGSAQAIDELAERSMPRRSTSLMLMQKLPFGLDFSLMAYWQDKMKWSVNTWAEKYRRFDARLAYPFRIGPMGGELAYVVQSLNGAHGEYKAYGDPADRVVDRRQWVFLQLNY